MSEHFLMRDFKVPTVIQGFSPGSQEKESIDPSKKHRQNTGSAYTGIVCIKTRDSTSAGTASSLAGERVSARCTLQGRQGNRITKQSVLRLRTLFARRNSI
jgi:hypothetical protein